MEVFRGHYVSHCFLMTYPGFWPFFHIFYSHNLYYVK